MREVAEAIKADMDAAAVKMYNDGPRTHLGASLIGRECKRELWFTLHWVKHKVHAGKQYRLFNRGHREEERIIAYLRAIGIEVWEYEDQETKKQIRISGVYGHFGGSLDGIGRLPEHYGIQSPVLLEFKTANDKKFGELPKFGVIRAQPTHFAQMSVYGFKHQLTHALYICVNKNNDDLHVELVKLDWKLGEQLEAKAAEVIAATSAPARIAANPTFLACKYCDYNGVCWHSEPLDINCRSCSSVSAVSDKQWYCNRHSAIIPVDVIAKGCGDWQPIYKVDK